MPGYNNGSGYFLYVGSINEVYSSNVPQGGSMYFMDRNNPYLYIKTVDVYGNASIDAYELNKKPLSDFYSQPQISSPVQSDFVRRDEIASIVAETIRSELRNHKSYHGKNRDKEEN